MEILNLLPRFKCKRCGNEWLPRVDKPKICPACKSKYWFKDKKNN